MSEGGREGGRELVSLSLSSSWLSSWLVCVGVFLALIFLVVIVCFFCFFCLCFWWLLPPSVPLLASSSRLCRLSGARVAGVALCCACASERDGH